MPLIKDGIEIENEWVFVEDDTGASLNQVPAFAGRGGVSYSLSYYLDNVDTLAPRNMPIGVRLSPGDDPADLLPYLDRIALIEISFPKYTDGRGYSQAQLLRRRYGYTGEMRAVGHALRDQILYMNRSGFDAFETTRVRLSECLEALSEHSAFYQPAADGHSSVFARRHERA